ncbi:hypothetical protein G7B40_040210 [Aetokthonos hydrillicola Thurmond2011]|jgi:lysozyme family protein|uniref:Peptidoglycan-binding protein n=1 Tax=Aetokthonos hydrillicola Thurmond2011 TaxID=2712845 RepID=A0AAP5IH39_9CYAN|nr:glycosyl hydrolase 108 family protein [Aetokthonos hydrillicola]MBO3459953.1 hypothetical protein [Aetokthonos hydrillicola CCALA 1050]MBW4584072.1 hypothetical protein [Aetokthonos hydrillicola CCALA 1050]MDR9900714.1 hypothetical protein [Aetokthonos hydrillicola Thurmond2011]
MNFISATDKDYTDALNLVLQFEGGYTNDPTDTGGETNYGIIHSEYDQYRRSKGLAPQNVRYMKLEEAKDIYRNKYWLGASCNQFTRRVAIAVFDWQVNSGRGVSTLQKCLGVKADGIVGHQTLNEFAYWLSKQSGEDRLLSNYFDNREHSYRCWGVGSQACFLEGWLNRLNQLKKYLGVE